VTKYSFKMLCCCIVCAKISSLTTADSSNMDNNHDEMIMAFMSVLECSSQEASFFLESTVWNIEEAVTLYLDTQQRADMGKKHKVDYAYAAKAHHVPVAVEYKRKQVFIQGLPDGWSAWVSRLNGGVFFVHDATGHTQTAVPPGFADIDVENDANSIAVAVDASPAAAIDLDSGTEANEDMEVWGIMNGPTPEIFDKVNCSSTTNSVDNLTPKSVEVGAFLSSWVGSAGADGKMRNSDAAEGGDVDISEFVGTGDSQATQFDSSVASASQATDSTDMSDA
jgi:hypothetical protein